MCGGHPGWRPKNVNRVQTVKARLPVGFLSWSSPSSKKCGADVAWDLLVCSGVRYCRPTLLGPPRCRPVPLKLPHRLPHIFSVSPYYWHPPAACRPFSRLPAAAPYC